MNLSHSCSGPLCWSCLFSGRNMALRWQKGPKDFSRFWSFAWCPAERELHWKSTDSWSLTAASWLSLYIYTSMLERKPYKRCAGSHQSIGFVRELKTVCVFIDFPRRCSSFSTDQPMMCCNYIYRWDLKKQPSVVKLVQKCLHKNIKVPFPGPAPLKHQVAC